MTNRLKSILTKTHHKPEFGATSSALVLATIAHGQLQTPD